MVVEYFSALVVFKKSVERCIGKRHTTCMRAESAGSSETALRHVPFTYSCFLQLQSDLVLLLLAGLAAPQPHCIFKDVPQKINANSTQLKI